MVAVIWVENGREENEWDYVLSNFKPELVYQNGSHRCTNNLLRDAPRGIPDGDLIVIAPLTAREFTPTISLVDFQHPKGGVYVFGPNNLHLSQEDLGRAPNAIVHIPTDTKDEMFNYGAYLVTMWDLRHG